MRAIGGDPCGTLGGLTHEREQLIADRPFTANKSTAYTAQNLKQLGGSIMDLEPYVLMLDVFSSPPLMQRCLVSGWVQGQGQACRCTANPPPLW